MSEEVVEMTKFEKACPRKELESSVKYIFDCVDYCYKKSEEYEKVIVELIDGIVKFMSARNGEQYQAGVDLIETADKYRCEYNSIYDGSIGLIWDELYRDWCNRLATHKRAVERRAAKADKVARTGISL